MKKLFLLATFSFTHCNYSSAQIICIFCYDQNDSISSGVNNLLLNGSFENHNCNPNNNNSTFCPNAFYYACDIADWTCTGGGVNTYAGTWTNAITQVPDGLYAVYFGSDFCSTCSPTPGDTSCLINIDCTVTGIPAGYPTNSPAYGGSAGLSLEQTVTGLTVGNTYVLEFWAGGEGFFNNRGVFAVDVGFGDTLLRCKTTPPGATGEVYIIQFIAAAAAHTIKFTNWGHICGDCTELILDNVRLYTLAELSPTVPACSSLSGGFFAASDTDLCEKFCINFFDSTGNNPTAWQWIFPGGNPSSSTDQNPTNICYTVPGTYDVTLITTNANGNDTLTFSNYITVFSTPPFPTITQVGYTLTSSPASSYQWQLNSLDIAGATNQSYNVPQTGLYSVVVGDSNGCVNSANKYVLITGMDDVLNEGDILIYPNPSGGTFMVELQNRIARNEFTIEVMNTLGQILFSETQQAAGKEVWKKEMDLGNAPQGVYYLEIKTGDSFVREKIIFLK